MPEFRPQLETLLTNDETVRRLKGLFADEEFVRATRTVIARPDFAARLDRITKILLGAGAEKVDRVALSILVLNSALLYGGVSWSAQRERTTLHEAAEPIACLVEILKREANRAGILKALGAPAYVPARGAEEAHGAAVKAAEAHYAIALDALEKIARALPDPPKKERGRPRTRDLDALVDLLAQCFEEMTGKAFTQDWHTDDQGKREPIPPGAKFVYEIIEFIDSERLAELPTVTSRVVSERRRATS